MCKKTTLAVRRIMKWFRNPVHQVVEFSDLENKVYEETKGFSGKETMQVFKSVLLLISNSQN